jgi:hypothetical protein
MFKYISFPRAAWECSAGRAASRIGTVTRGVARIDRIPTQRVTAIKLRDTLVPKLQLGNPVSKALALRAGKPELPVLNSQAGAWELARRRGSFFLNLMAVT